MKLVSTNKRFVAPICGYLNEANRKLQAA